MGPTSAVRTGPVARALRLGRPLLLPALAVVTHAMPVAQGEAPQAVVYPADAGFREQLAAREVRRYVYVCTGALLPLGPADEAAGPRLAVGDAARLLAATLLPAGADELCATLVDLGPQEYLLRRVEGADGPLYLVAGGDSAGTLYGAYRLAELLGARFYLHGDVVPDRPAPWALDALDERASPLFELRGIQPFHDFPEGPDWWELDDYLAVLAQLPKLRMNFFGLHTYPEGGVGPEPAVWIGLPEDVEPDGGVAASYPARHFTTHTGGWGYAPRDTGDYDFGAAQLFAQDVHGARYMEGLAPLPATAADQDLLFERFGRLLERSFGFARDLAIHTCLGTETPLIVPGRLQERLRAAGLDPADPAVVRRLYEGLFRRIQRTHPLDTYWLWTPEGWTWSGVAEGDVERTVRDLGLAAEAARAVGAPFQLATCGWVLGPPDDRALFDRILPPGAPVSCINRNVGFAPVEVGFAAVSDRPQWAIPWLEDDPALLVPQLWVGRMRRDAADALALGCSGLMGIHWRTRILGPNVAALARAGWDQAGWNPELGRAWEAPEPGAGEGVDGGREAHFPTSAFADTELDEVYRSVLYDLDAYTLAVPAGRCRVTLAFCEPHYRETGQRVFGVTLQGERVVERLDVFERVGPDRALELVFEDVAAPEGLLRVGFPRLVEFPCIAAIRVEGQGWSRAVNCGGPAALGHEACLSREAVPPSWPPGRSRDAPAEDFYADWARTQFGPEAAAEIAALFVALDGGPGAFSEGQRNTRLPRPSTWIGGPGGVRPDPRPWAEARGDYAFVEELAALRPRVRGAGDLERFDYWLGSLRYLRAVGRVSCAWAAFGATMGAVEAAPEPGERRRVAREQALPARVELVEAVAAAHDLLLATITTRGGLGTVANWQQHVGPALLGGPGVALEEALGEPLPAEARPRADYRGPPRLVVPTVRTSVERGAPLELEVIVLGARPEEAAVHWAPLGARTFRALPLQHVARGVHRATLPPAATGADLEYFVRVETDGGEVLHFPPTAPAHGQTVVVLPERP